MLETAAPCGFATRDSTVCSIYGTRVDAPANLPTPSSSRNVSSPAIPGSRRARLELNASHAHLERLSLRDCTVSGVELSGAVINGALELDGIRGPGDRGPCWVRARGVRVGGSLSARKSKLRQPWPLATKWPPDEPGWQNLTGPYALDLTGAEIGGSLTLWPEFEAIGGVSISGATIGEGLRAPGARLDAADVGSSTDALFAQYARISGAVFLGMDGERPVRAQGPLNFYGAEIEGAVNLIGVKATASRIGVEATASRDPARSALFMPAVSVAGDALFYPGRLLSVNLENATFGAKLDIGGSPIDEVSATACRVRGDLFLGGTISKADFSGSVIEGRLALGEGEFRLRLRSINGAVARVSFTDARVGRGLDVVVPIETDTRHSVNADWAGPPLRIRSHELTCYPGSGWHVAVALYPDSFGNGCALLNFLHRRNDAEVEVVVLEGMSHSIHALSDSLDIKKRPAALEFLEFFCANIWGDDGPFLIEPGTVELTPGGVKGQWHAKANLRYGTARFGAEFKLEPDGTVTMSGDHLLEPPVAEKPDRLYLKPIRWFHDSTSQPGWPADISVSEPEGDAWNELDLRVEENLVGALSSALDHRDLVVGTTDWSPPGQPRPTIDLGGLKVASLKDNDGRNWFEQENPLIPGTRTTKLALQLVGFEYDRIQQRDESPRGGALTARSESSAEPSFESATQEGTATEATEDEKVASESSPPETVGTATLRDSGRLPGSVFRPNTWPAAIGRRFASPRERVQRTDSSEGANGSEDGADLVRARRTWLESQYPTLPPTSDRYQPEPYAQLARVLRLSGFFKQANDITYEKNKLLANLRPDSQCPGRRRFWHSLKRPLKLLAVLTVGSAVVKPGRMWGLFAAFYVIGVLILVFQPNALKLETSAVPTTLATRGGVVVQQNIVPTNRRVNEIVCGNHISKLVYPIDVMIPFVNLGQESRCDFGPNQQGWAVGKGLYALLGWILTGGVILSTSGLIRRQFEL